MKKLILTALILVTISTSATQAMMTEDAVRRHLGDTVRAIQMLPAAQRRDALIRQDRRGVRALNQLPEDQRQRQVDLQRRALAPYANQFRNATEAQRRDWFELTRDTAQELSNEERAILADLYRDFPGNAEAIMGAGDGTGALAWIGKNPGKSALSATAMVLTGLTVYHRDKLGEVGQQAIAWMKENKDISIAIITTIILGSYGMYLFANWNPDNDKDKSFGDNFTAANGKLWIDTAGKAWTFATGNPWYMAITAGGMAAAGTAGYLLSKKAATAMYDEITGQYDDDFLS